MDDKFIATFLDESFDLLNTMEEDLLALEENPAESSHIQSVFRSAHTIKGSAAMFGFKHISEFAHAFENALDSVRSGTTGISKEMIDVALQGKDHLRTLLQENSKEPSDELIGVSKEILNQLSAITGAGSTPKQPAKIQKSPDAKKTKDKTYRIAFNPGKMLFKEGTNPLLLLKEIASLGEATVFCNVNSVPILSRLDPEDLFLSWEIILTSTSSYEEIRDVFIFVESSSEVIVDELNKDQYLSDDGQPKRLGEILVENGHLSSKELKTILANHKLLGEMITEAGLLDSVEIEKELHIQEHFKKKSETQQKDVQQHSLRVSSSRLDQLVDLVGELVTVQARLTGVSESIRNDNLSGISEELERLIDNLRDNAMSLRMVPIGSTFAQFKRLVRDLSQELDKEIEMVTIGGETELDKSVISKLNDPLVHIIRNAIDHGMESPEEREKNGKSRKGKITIEAEHAGASVLIIIRDDGKGIDPEKVKARAVEKGLIGARDNPTESEIFQLLFAPGFSTAEKVTNVSGRGVGLDVVAKNIQALSGMVVVESTPGEGSSFTLSLPLTLAIIDGLRVSIGSEIFILPLGVVESCLEINMENLDKRRRMINHRGSLLPFLDLADYLGIDTRQESLRQMVIIESRQGKIGLLVDEVLGDHQTVIKSLGSMFRDQRIFSGATIMGDGSIALIIDINGLASVIGRDVHLTDGK